MYASAQTARLAPWAGRVMIGTTDTPYDGPLDDAECTAADVEALLAAVNPHLPGPVTAGDVVGSWAGLRPLIDDSRSGDLSRRHRVVVSPAGVVSVVGGKLTTYRRMAADAVDRVPAARGRPCRTAGLAIRGGGPRPPGVSDHLWSRYGNEAPEVAAMAGSGPALSEPLVAGLPYLRAEAVWAVRHEMATTVDDVLSRRTRALILDRQAAARAAPSVADLLAAELGWSPAERDRALSNFVA